MARKISAEIEFEHDKLTREQLKILRSAFRRKYSDIRFMPDLSLANTGIEISAPLSQVDNLKEACKKLQALGFHFTHRCGLHLHVDLSDNLTLPFIKKAFSNIAKVQEAMDPEIRRKVSSLHHRFFPKSVIKEIVKQKSVPNVFKSYVNELSGYTAIRNKDDFKDSLVKKVATHSMWIDLAPWFRKVFNEPMTLPSGRMIGGYGSIEIRGPITYGLMSAVNVDLWEGVKKTMMRDLLFIEEIVGFKILNAKEFK